MWQRWIRPLPGHVKFALFAIGFFIIVASCEQSCELIWVVPVTFISVYQLFSSIPYRFSFVGRDTQHHCLYTHSTCDCAGFTIPWGKCGHILSTLTREHRCQLSYQNIWGEWIDITPNIYLLRPRLEHGFLTFVEVHHNHDIPA